MGLVVCVGIRFRFLLKTCLSDLVGGIRGTDTAGGDETQSGDSIQVGTYKQESDRHM